MVAPILLYAAEVWDIYGLKQDDKLHIKFCKRILGVRTKTQNLVVYGELGRYHLSIIAKERAVKLWMKVKINNESIMSRIFNKQSLIANRSNSLWINKVKQRLNYNGPAYLSDRDNLDNSDLIVLQNRLRDHFKQEWYSFINNSSKLEYYCRYKDHFEFEPYLNNSNNEYLRIALTKFRLSSHKLEI